MSTPVQTKLTPPADTDDLRRVFGAFPSGVVSVCALVDGNAVGMAFSSFTSVSLDPPLVSICPAHSSRTWPSLRRAPRLGVSVLGVSQAETARRLSSRNGDRFADLEVASSEDGALFLPDAAAWIDCTVEAELRGGDHDVVLLRVQRMAIPSDADPLVFHASSFHRLDPLAGSGRG
ncbi:MULTISPECIES: flavin reductase family protein [Amycolatopsis]|uniref:flavin reductase family protein n=1 Tax=Amycolatopsis TaxID=1813 RepID=UPI001F42DA7C|nr:flavin reductase family protein [Amycolatopsis tucumanensis]MCF6424119.1 flavin reductase family protein [Amycolatopsis tucumanensis]